MNNYVFVLSTSVLSIAAFSYHEALEILVFSVGIDEARDYLFSELGNQNHEHNDNKHNISIPSGTLHVGRLRNH